MEAIAVFAIGCVFGAITGIGLRSLQTKEWSGWPKILATLVAGVFGAGILPVIERFGGTELKGILAFYPFGVLFALLWAFAITSEKRINSPVRNIRIYGWLHIAALTSLSLFVLLLFVSESFRNSLPTIDK